MSGLGDGVRNEASISPTLEHRKGLDVPPEAQAGVRPRALRWVPFSAEASLQAWTDGGHAGIFLHQRVIFLSWRKHSCRAQVTPRPSPALDPQSTNADRPLRHAFNN